MALTLVTGGVVAIGAANATGEGKSSAGSDVCQDPALLNGAQNVCEITLANAENQTGESAALVDAPVATVAPTKDETVYLMASATGDFNQVFIGSRLYTGSQSLPVALEVKYYLDGEEISPAALSGQSGHVKIEYQYQTLVTYQNKKVPFLAVTGLSLDSAKFSNLQITNGKIVASGDSYIVAGYGVAGLNENFGSDLIASSFSLEADVQDFALSTTYTMFTPSVFADLDVTKLTSVDEIIGAVNDLSSGLDQILAGAGDLSAGLDTLITSSDALVKGANKLSTGLNELTSHNAEIISGAAGVFEALIGQANQTIAGAIGESTTLYLTGAGLFPLTTENYETALSSMSTMLAAGGLTEQSEALSVLQGSLLEYQTFYNGLLSYTEGVAAAATGATTLSQSLPALIDGETALYNGAVELQAGISTFKTTGLDKLVDFANGDISNFVYNTRKSVDAARSYHSFANPVAESVKFIVKTASVK